MSKDSFSLVLNCGHWEYNGLVMCAGTENVLVDFSKLFGKEEHNEIMDFLDHTCGFFDQPMSDWNQIINTIKHLRDKFSLIDEVMWQGLYVWLPQHKRCGACLRLVFNDQIQKIGEVEELVMPKKTRSRKRGTTKKKVKTEDKPQEPQTDEQQPSG